MSEGSGSIDHLSTDDVLAIHELVVESNDGTEPGISSRGDVEYAVEAVRDGHFGQGPETLHARAFQLLRLIAANHPFVDGNKRTALMSIRVFYALNGLRFDYDREIKAILKDLATDEAAVDDGTVRSYLEEHTEALAPEYAATIELWLSHSSIDEAMSQDIDGEPSENEGRERPNDYDGDNRSKE